MIFQREKQHVLLRRKSVGEVKIRKTGLCSGRALHQCLIIGEVSRKINCILAVLSVKTVP